MEESIEHKSLFLVFNEYFFTNYSSVDDINLRELEKTFGDDVGDFLEIIEPYFEMRYVWLLLSCTPLSEKQILRFSTKLSMSNVSRYQELSLKFILEHTDILWGDRIIFNQNIPSTVIEALYNKAKTVNMMKDDSPAFWESFLIYYKMYGRKQRDNITDDCFSPF